MVVRHRFSCSPRFFEFTKWWMGCGCCCLSSFLLLPKVSWVIIRSTKSGKDIIWNNICCSTCCCKFLWGAPSLTARRMKAGMSPLTSLTWPHFRSKWVHVTGSSQKLLTAPYYKSVCFVFPDFCWCITGQDEEVLNFILLGEWGETLLPGQQVMADRMAEWAEDSPLSFIATQGDNF